MQIFLIFVFAGGLVTIWLFSMLLERFLFSRLFDDPVKGKLSALFCGWVLASALVGSGFGLGLSLYWQAFLVYAIPTGILGLFGYRRGRALRDAKGESVATIFE